MRAFFDTNVLVYALTERSGPHHDTALRLVAQHATARTLVLSPQVLLETYNVLTRKKGVAASTALQAVTLLASADVVAPGAQSTLQALQLATAHRLSTWDAMIVQAALLGGCDTLYSQDLQAGRRFGALEVVDPFEAAAHEPAPAAAPRSRSRRSGGPAAR